MKKSWFVAFIILCFVLLSFNMIGAKVREGKVDKEVLDKVSKKDSKTRVFIEFKDNGKENMERVIERIGSEKLRYRFNNSISAEVDKEDIEELENDPGVKEIKSVGVRQISLQTSVPLINATASFRLQVNGLNLTGKGQTICIIDTGINYTHPALGGCYGDNNLSSGCKVWGGFDYCADNGNCAANDSTPDDLNGHGTHVSGIASANGSITGVAPESRIVMLKVCNSTGSCPDDAIMAGIKWCVANATTFNISVISMSLGGGLSTGYCNDDPLAADINDAVGHNIPVVVASGNTNSVTSMAGPACVQNATPVGSIQKDDSTFPSFSRNNLLNLIAPGVSINSTYLSSTGYSSLSGTSMATPHVAGAIAIIREFLNVTGRSRTPEEIEIILNNTGKRILDSSSGITFSRINIYGAIISLDNSTPNVSLASPVNNSVMLRGNLTFFCNATDLALKNATFYIWNSTGLYNSSSRSANGDSYSYGINLSSVPVEDYEWNCLYSDENGNWAMGSSNNTLFVREGQVSLLSPSNNAFTNLNQTFSCNSSSANQLMNITFYIWNSSSLETTINKSVSGTANSSTFSFNFSHGGNYLWNCLSFDNTSTGAFATSNFSITYDLTRPALSVLSPLNESWGNAGRFNVSLNENGTCSYSLNFGGINNSMSSSDNRGFNATNTTMAQGQIYNLSFYCNDSAGNTNSSFVNFNIDLTKPNVSLVSPEDAHSETGTSTISFRYNVSDNLNISSCSLILNNESASGNQSEITNGTNSIDYPVSVGNYNWGINCTDIAGNIGNSTVRSLMINSPPSSDSGGSGGGGGRVLAGEIYTPSQEETSGGYSQDLKKSDSIKFDIFDETFVKYNLIVDFIGDNFANFTIKRNESKKIVLGLGQGIKLNLTSADYYDLFLRLDDIANDKVKLTIQTIHEPIIKGQGEKSEVKNETERNFRTIQEDKGSYKPYIIASIIAIIMIILTRIFYLRSKRDMKKEIIKEVEKEFRRRKLRKKEKSI